jgi:hypothetical protein
VVFPKVLFTWPTSSIAHRQLYEKAAIIHGDISLDNLMANSSDHSQGVLVGLDMAQRVGIRQWCDPFSCTARNAALATCGTATFKALDLLREGPPPQPLYRHDLESFFYALVWLVTQHEDGQPVVPPHIPGWCVGAGPHWSATYDAKKAFLAGTGSQSLHCKHELARTWLPRLRQMFHSGYAAWDMIREPPAPIADVTRDSGAVAQNASAPSHAAAFDVETLGGHVTYEKFIEILAGF